MSLKDLYSAVICDALDELGYTNQAIRTLFYDYSQTGGIYGRCKTTLWVDIYDEDESPYELELKAVDECQAGDVLICAAGGSTRSGIFGELLTTAALNSDCAGVLVHGCVRDVQKMREMNFPVFATGKNPYNSLNRQRVAEVDVTVQIDNVVINPGDLLYGDEDGLVVIPKEVEEEALSLARNKVHEENRSRDSIREGMKATEAYAKYGVL